MSILNNVEVVGIDDLLATGTIDADDLIMVMRGGIARKIGAQTMIDALALLIDGVPANLDMERDDETVTVLSSSGDDVVLPAATDALAGVMTAESFNDLADATETISNLATIIAMVATGLNLTQLQGNLPTGRISGFSHTTGRVVLGNLQILYGTSIGTTADNIAYVGSVTFSHPFAITPVVLKDWDASPADVRLITLGGSVTSTNGFSWAARNNTTFATTGVSVINWLALGTITV